MALTNVIGLSVFFIVDLIDIYFISLLHQPHLVAAIGYAAAILFFSSSLSIAMMIANSAVIAKSIGQQDILSAQKSALTCYLLTFIFSIFISLIIFYNTTTILSMIGAQARELEAAAHYLKIVVFSIPLAALSMQIIATLRALGKAKLAMICTLIGGVVNLILDPLLIFYFKLDLNGVAFASIIARMAMLLLGGYYLLYQHRFIVRMKLDDFKVNTHKILKIALPVSLTQMITPMSHLYITYEIAKFGSDFMAGWAIISRLIPVAFIMLFAMPGSIGPIISQNLGAKNIIRVKDTLNISLNFIIKYVLVLALTLSFLQEFLIQLFNARNDAAILLRFFCQYIPISFIFVAMNLVAMSFLNNVGHAKVATLLNAGKMFFGIIPFVSLGAYYYGAQGILVGQAVASIIFSLIAIVICYKNLSKLKAQ
ncbi:MATE family efflux transporter [Psychromonas algarum]|uniref:MATE family efflux transporter n=1 Tax=Psychromonas algarum TaxID=2555643 RepID=UPI001FBB3C6D|nr:MATE family efflux transporter [Psychromonas sp. RZ22]